LEERTHLYVLGKIGLVEPRFPKGRIAANDLESLINEQLFLLLCIL
jgi:hypothetical protein